MTRSPEPHRRYSWAHSSLGGYTDGEHLAESEISRSRKRYAYYDLDSPIGPRPLTRTRPNGLKPAPVDDLFRKSVRGPRQISYESETDTPNKHGERKRTGRDPREDRKNDGSSTPTVTKAGTARPPAESPAEPDPMHIQMLAELEKETRPRAEASTVVSVPTFGFALPTVKPESRSGRRRSPESSTGTGPTGSGSGQTGSMAAATSTCTPMALQATGPQVPASPTATERRGSGGAKGSLFCTRGRAMTRRPWRWSPASRSPWSALPGFSPC